MNDKIYDDCFFYANIEGKITKEGIVMEIGDKPHWFFKKHSNFIRFLFKHQRELCLRRIYNTVNDFDVDENGFCVVTVEMFKYVIDFIQQNFSHSHMEKQFLKVATRLLNDLNEKKINLDEETNIIQERLKAMRLKMDICFDCKKMFAVGENEKKSHVCGCIEKQLNSEVSELSKDSYKKEIKEAPKIPDEEKEESVELDESLMCVMCMERKITTVILDCRMSILCVTCSRKLMANKEMAKCPTCRKDIEKGIIKIFN